MRFTQRLGVLVAVFGAILTLGVGNAFAAPGDPEITVPINDSAAGGTYQQTFDLAYSGTTPDGTPVYIYVPEGGIGTVEGVQSLDPQFDPNPADDFVPCATTPNEDFVITQAQIDQLGSELTGNPVDPGIIYVDEQHYGEMGGSDALVVLVYNIQDTSYYDCAETTYTAGYFAPDYLTSTGMNVIVIDAYDWANRVGAQAGNADGVPYLVEGVIAHEFEHLLMNYSDPGELSWVDEGLADLAIFLNAYPAGGSHVAYHQVFHRETSLTRWGGGLENYGASFTWFLYLWEQAGGNGLGDEDPRYAPDQNYDAMGGDLLIKLIFEHADDGMAGIQAAIDEFNTMGHPGLETPLRSADELFEDWVIAIYRDDEDSARFDIKNLDFGDPDDSWGYTIDLANDFFWKNRGIYGGATPSGKFEHSPHVPGQVALPFGTSYEIFRNPGPTFSLTFDGDDTTRIAPHSEPTHWWGGYESQSDNVLNVDGAPADLSGATIDFWTWYFIEEGWDYGYVEALVNGEWVTVPLFNDAGTEVTTDTNPHDNNTEGNGLTGTSGGQYFVDDPQYIHLTGTLPEGSTDVRFRYSTDAAYLDTGWFIDDVSINGASVDGLLTSPAGEWLLTTGTQTNNWLVQILSPCDLSPGVETPGESVVDGFYLYRLGDDVSLTNLSSRCLGNKGTFTVVISNMPTGELTSLDADYFFRVTNTSNSTK